MRGTVAFILKGYPRLSETFIAQEIHALEQSGLTIAIVSLRHPTDPYRHPIHDAITAPVSYLPEYLWRQPLRLWRGWRQARRMAGYDAARRVWLDDLQRDPSANRVRRFGQAVVLAAEIDPAVVHLHAHFLHTPSSVARYAALMTGLPWSCSAHAKDIWTSPAWEKREKLASCAWAVTCAAASLDHLATLAPADRVELVYHGLDVARFPVTDRQRDNQPRDGGDGGRPVVILAVGRAVEKKGFDDLLAALAALPNELHWRLVHIGGGERRQALAEQARAAGLDDRVDWRGAQPHDVVLAAYRAADLFVLPSRIARNGDRDGLPNVLMEAMSQSLCVLSTRVSGILELIDHDETGHLIDGGDRRGLSTALAELITDPARRTRLGQAGEARVRRDFVMDRGINRLAVKFGLTA
ncbi:MAG: glycosyltransferase family 4 protein [Pseudomonadota bacterium]|nr:glycosyltransferase family 4 protein [Pseudomonadota bacterium]